MKAFCLFIHCTIRMAGAAKLNTHYSNARNLLTVTNSTISYISIFKIVAAVLSIHDNVKAHNVLVQKLKREPPTDRRSFNIRIQNK